MEVAAPVVDHLTFDSGCSTPYTSAPSSPQRHQLFYSAPSSPSRAVAIFYAHFNRHPSFKDANFSSPPLPSSEMEDNDQEFEFGFSGSSEEKISLASAEELFHHGVIKPLVKDQVVSFEKEETKVERFETRGRDDYKTNYVKKKTRSLSPSRASNIPCPAATTDCPAANNNNASSSSTSFWDSFLFSRAYRSWNLKDLLFRSASEGHAPREQHHHHVVSNYVVPVPTNLQCDEELRSSSVRSSRSESRSINWRIHNVKDSSFGSVGSDGDGSVRSPRRRRNGLISAHEQHYKVNRAVSEEMKKKAFLPYWKGLMGCAGLDAVVSDAIGAMSRS